VCRCGDLSLRSIPQASAISFPYGSLDYNITPTFERVNNSRELVVVISVILTGADYRESPQAIQNTVDQKEAAALNYIRSKGFDPSKYHIQYSVPAH
jgi:hypothetical protein